MAGVNQPVHTGRSPFCESLYSSERLHGFLLGGVGVEQVYQVGGRQRFLDAGGQVTQRQRSR